MHQSGAGVGAVEDAIARVLEQDSLQSASQALCLAVAENRDRHPVGELFGARRGGEKKKTKNKDRRPPDPASGTAKPTVSAHRALPPNNP